MVDEMTKRSHFPNSGSHKTGGQRSRARERVGWTLARVSMISGVRAAKVRKWELDPTSVDARTADWLGEFYDELARCELPP
jgi:hypothetical protein